MAHKICSECINCGACESECPVSAICETDGIRVIDSSTCIDCGMCSGSCPVEAISAE